MAFCSSFGLALGAMLQGCSALPGSTNSSVAERGSFGTGSAAFQKAGQLFLDGKRAAALQEADRALAVSPDDADLLSLKGAIESYDCQYRKALDDYSRAIAKQPSSAIAYQGRGEAYMRLGRFDQARLDLRKAMSLTGDGDRDAFLRQVDSLEYDSQHALSDPAKLWTIACTASLLASHGNGSKTLLGSIPTADAIEQPAFILSQWWGVTSRATLIARLRDLIKGGDTVRWQAMRMVLNDPAQLNKFRSNWSNPQDYDRAVDLLKQHGADYGARGLAAWDYCRYMNICREAYQAKYISEDDAWELMMPMAAKIQSLFKSWEQMEAEYLVGREFWSQSTWSRNSFGYMRSANLLLKDPNSPWKTLPWNTKLGTKSDDASITAAINKVAARRLGSG